MICRDDFSSVKPIMIQEKNGTHLAVDAWTTFFTFWGELKMAIQLETYIYLSLYFVTTLCLVFKIYSEIKCGKKRIRRGSKEKTVTRVRALWNGRRENRVIE